MGWLDNSTNNIILDAVLTDLGRQKLAQGDGSFNITKFALGDDEVDYSIIKKYGRTVGREKIEKNTPVFEAFTNQSLSQKYKTFGTAFPILYIPQIELIGPTGGVIINTTASNTSNVVVTIAQRAKGDTQIPGDLVETSFDIQIPDIFLTISNQSATYVGANNPKSKTAKVATFSRIANYTIDSTNTTVQPQITFNLIPRNIPDTVWNVYGRITSTTTKTINTSIKAIGRITGQVLDIPVSITKSI